MRAFFGTVLIGVIVGLALGFGLGKFQAAQMKWSPKLEINKGVEIAKAGTEADVAATEQKSSEEKKPEKKAKKFPRVKVEEDEFDFGIIEKNPSTEKGEHPFYIENVGNADMTLADGGKGCFCTTFTISKSVLKPGEKATVLFKWDGARSGGVFNQGVRVLTNDPDCKEITFAVRGLYTSPIICDVGEITFQNASSSIDSSRSFRIMGFEKNEDGTPFPLEITGVELSAPEQFSVDIQKEDLSSLTDDDKKSRLYSQTQNIFSGILTMKSGMRQGAFKELMRLRTNSPKMPILEVGVSGQIASNNVKVSGALFDEKTSGQLHLDSVPQSTGKSTNVRLTVFEKIPANEETIKVKSVRPEWIKVKLTYPDEELQKVSPIRMIEATIEVPAGSPQGAFMGPEKEQLGEVVFSIGATEESSQEVVLPVRFAVTQ